ncbi:NADPH:quinone reductase [Mucilaginibacter mallensis]|uniref:NADPH:quinone reductase n=1 Tax=Mucilaginibacter mallensis TaxID=652787 RepID=A0A1H1XLV8_MUCMA|nr:NADP-dependent oxidoreductase [Mucilaginibacter mallensis]SDT10188.1 NADPH:quinone reductase [Mucilaginibacter mallensis]
MKAIILNGFGDVSNFSLAEIDVPVIKDDEVLIQLKAAAFNPIDYQMRLGLRESRIMKSPVLGRELSGVIVEIGKNVIGYHVGDEIIAASGSRGSNGSYAEFMALNSSFIAHKPANISFEAAAAIPSAGLTAWQCFNRMPIETNSSVFISGGAGAVGRFLIKLLLINGCTNIVTTAGSEQSINALIALGLKSSQIIDYKKDNMEQNILNANNGRGFDFAVEIVGGVLAETAANVLDINGTYVDVTFLGTELTRETLFDKGCVIINIANYAQAAKNANWYGQTLNELTDLIRQNKMSPPEINRVGDLSVETVRLAHTLMETNQIFGKKLVMSI